MRRPVIVIAALLIASPALADGLNTLIEVGKAQGEIAREAKEETQHYDRAAWAIESGRVKPGMTKSEAQKECGEPVIILERTAAAQEQWVYKPAASTFFDGVKIYLVFDDNGILTEVRKLGQRAPAPRQAPKNRR